MAKESSKAEEPIKVASLDDIHADNLRIISGLNQVLKTMGRPPV